MTDSGRKVRWRRTLLLLIVLVVGAVLRLELVSHASFDLLTRPDALEYGVGAANLARGQGLALEIDGRDYPSRYPYGVALLLAPVVALAGGDPAYAFVGEFLLGLLCIALTWQLARPLGGIRGAAFAAFVVAISPHHAVFSTLVMSEVPSTFALLAGTLAFTWWSARPRSSRHLLWIGAIAGFSASIRWANLLLLVPMGVALLNPPAEGTPRPSPAERWRALLLLVTGALIALAPEWIVRAWHFGSPLRTGYHFWQPDEYVSWRTTYNPAFLFEPPRPGWGSGNLAVYARGLSGWRASLWSPITALLALIGALFALKQWREPRRLACLLLPVVTIGFYLPYYFRDQRMSMPVVPFGAALAGLALARGTAYLRSPVQRGVLFLLAVAAAVVGPVVGMPERGRFSVASELAVKLEQAAAGRGVVLHDAILAAARSLPADAVLVADLARLQLGLYLPPSVAVVNLWIDREQDEGEGPDEEVRLIHRNGLRPLDGAPARPRVLLLDGKFDEATVLFLREAAAAGRPIEVWLTHKSPVARLAPQLGSLFELVPLPPLAPAAPSTSEAVGSGVLSRFRVALRAR